MTKKPAISEQTQREILDAAWSLATERNSLNLPFAEIARAVGVSRQTLYLAFGSRGRLLLAMLDNRDAQSPQVRRMVEARAGATGTRGDLEDYVDAWIEYLPTVYPIATLLQAAADTDPDAAEGYRSRFHDRLRMGLLGVMQKIAAAGALAPGLTETEAADIAWSLIHPAAWRLLVVECGWPPERFRQTRLEAIRPMVLSGPENSPGTEA